MAKKKVKAGFLFTVERAEVQSYEIVVTLRRVYDPLLGLDKDFIKALHNSDGNVWLFPRKEKRDKG